MTEGNHDNTTKTGWNNNRRYNRNAYSNTGTTDPGRQHPRRYRRPWAIRSLAEQTIDTPDDKDFTQNEVRQVVEGFKPRKAPGPDGITNEIQQLFYKGMPKTTTATYNEYLRTGKRPKYFQ